MLTSYFGNVDNIPDHLEPVGIARGTPRTFGGRSLKTLAPTWDMLRLPPEEYDARFNVILARLDPQAVFDELGADAVLLCWEEPHYRCHRRRVAEWLEASLGIIVPELGFMVEVGVCDDNLDALRSITARAAVLNGFGDTLGTLEAGKFGDVIVVDGKPDQDLTALERVEMTFINGKRMH